MTDAMTHHSDAELLAAFVDGQLEPEQLQLVTTHLASCEECRGLIGAAAAFEQEQEVTTQVKSKRAWMAVAAAVVVAVVGAYPLGHRYLHGRDIKEQAEEIWEAQTTKRVVEARFTGQPSSRKYSVNRGVKNSAEPNTEEEDRIQAAAWRLLDTTKDDTSREGLRAHAFAQVFAKEVEGAVKTLDRIPPEARDAATWNDIATVNAAARNYGAALDAVTQALKSQPKMPEALFNRAVILKNLEIDHPNLRPDVIRAWNDYLAVDPKGSWADEANKDLERLKDQ